MKIQESIETSISCLSDGDLVDKAYSGLLSILELVKTDKNTGKIGNMWINNGGRIRRDWDVFEPLVKGIYIPGSERCFWSGFLDPVDHPPPESGCVYIKPRYTNYSFEFITIKRIRRFPKHAVCQCKNPAFIYKTINVFVPSNSSDDVFCEPGYVAIDKDGLFHTVTDRLKLRNNLLGNIITSIKEDFQNANHFAGGAISLLSDRRYLWNVRTEEDSGFSAPAVVNFGVEKELIKSLFFARDEPMTKLGRKRPILHWVKAHERRIKKGIGIEIDRYLRGITKFKMGELEFSITKPIKGGISIN